MDGLQAELNEFDKQANEIIGVGWGLRSDSSAGTARKVRKCLENKVYMHFYAAWFPDNGRARSGYGEAMKA